MRFLSAIFHVDARLPDLSGEVSHGLLYGERRVHGEGAGPDLLPGGTLQLNQIVGEINDCHVVES